MKERPILFSAPMVKAILNGQKTMTRRVTTKYYGEVGNRLWVKETWRVGMREDPYQQYKGVQHKADELFPENEKDEFPVWVLPEAMSMEVSPHWKPSIFMPRWASRITLEITDIKVERLQDITEEDAVKEGINQHPYEYADSTYYDERPEIAGLEANIAAFAGLWDSINGGKPGKAWNDNPWVWVIEFKEVK